MPGDDNLLSSLPREIEPPPDLEDRVADTLKSRGLLGAGAARAASRWRIPLAAAASVALLAMGVLIGRATVEPGIQGGTVTGTDSNVYALLLFENDEYDAPQGAELMTRYSEYNQWVATAVRRQQFLAGEDLATTGGWLIEPSAEGPKMSSQAAPPKAAPLSGIFFIRADGVDEALRLAGELPHVRHGGQVLVQRTVPTVEPPD